MIQLRINSYTQHDRELLQFALTRGMLSVRQSCPSDCTNCENKRVCRDLSDSIDYLTNGTTNDSHKEKLFTKS